MAVTPQEAVDRFMADKAVNGASTAVAVVDLATGKTTAASGEPRSLIPASVMKAVTTGSLMNEVDDDTHYRTEVFTDGPVRGGILEGNIIVVGSGDPSLNSRHDPLSDDFCKEITGALRRRGIDSIAGRVIIDGSIFPGPAVPPSWAKGDLSTYYGTGVHGLNFEDNASGRSSVPNPAAVFESRLKSALTSAGISLASQSLPQGERIFLTAHTSPQIYEIMRSCMMRSDNMFAESLLRTYALRRGRPGSTEEAARLEKDYWTRRGLPMEGVTIVDGSGLSRANRLTAEFLAGVLTEMADNVEYASFFPLAGQEGTLKKFLAGTPLATYIALKTGSMNGIQCYAGYKVDEDFAPTHAVVVIGNSFPGSRAAFRQAVETMLLEIFTTGDSAPLNPEEAE